MASMSVAAAVRHGSDSSAECSIRSATQASGGGAISIDRRRQAGLNSTVRYRLGVPHPFQRRVLDLDQQPDPAHVPIGARHGQGGVLSLLAKTGEGGVLELLELIQQLQVVPGTSGGVFSVQWTAEMAFAVIIGGIGTIEGPIVGTAVFIVLQQTLESYNAWYLIILGLVAIVIAIFFRRGLWGTLDDKVNLRLLPTGYYLWPADATRRRFRRSKADATQG